MKKRLLIITLSVLSVIVCAFGFIACKDDPANTPETDNPPNTEVVESNKMDGVYKYYAYIEYNEKGQWHEGGTWTFENGKYSVEHAMGVVEGVYSINNDGAIEFTANYTGLAADEPMEMTDKYICEYVEDGILKVRIVETTIGIPSQLQKTYLCKDGLLPPGVDESEVLKESELLGEGD